MKKTLSVALATGLFMTQPVLAQTDHKSLDKQLDIMTNILKTAFKQENTSVMRVTGIDASYLEGQGVLYSLKVSGDKYNRRFDYDFNFNFDGMEGFEFVVPEPPEVHVSPNSIYIDEEGAEHFVHETQEIVENAMRVARDSLRSARESLRNLRDKERDLAHEERDIEREIRDIEFEKRHANKERQQEIDKELAKLKEAKTKLKQKQQKVTKHAKEIEAEQQEKAKKNMQMQTENYKKFVRNYVRVVTQTLCNYGASLRALPNKENVNFVIDDIRIPGEKESKDMIHVFNMADVKKCVVGDIEADKLYKSAVTYNF